MTRDFLRAFSRNAVFTLESGPIPVSYKHLDVYKRQALYLLVFTDLFSYAMDRVYGWLWPFDPPEGVDTWQTRQSLMTIGSGGLLGLGLGQSRQKYLYLPEPQNDFIFAIVCEELGFIGALIIIILFAMLVWRGIVVSLKAKDKFGMLLGVGLTFQIGLQVILNIMAVSYTHLDVYKRQYQYGAGR